MLNRLKSSRGVFRFFMLFILLLNTNPLFAEDTAFVQLLGFSEDGKYMAFQQSILQDGSGDYISKIYILDNFNDKYVKILKERFETQSNEVTLSKSFASFVSETKEKYMSQLNMYNISEKNGQTIHVSVAPRLSSFVVDGKYLTLILSNTVVATKDNRRLEMCLSMDALSGDKKGLNGFNLSGFSIDTDRPMFTLHEDAVIPSSRDCPVSYSLSNAFKYKNQVVFLVSVTKIGFEGPDIDYVTVPADLSKL